MIDRFEELVTVFGGGGFIGRYVCEFLMKSGVRVRVAQRNPKQAYIIQPLGQVGQFGFVQADITNRDTVLRALEGASVAVNLVGVFGSKMHGVHVDGARNIAEAASDRGLDALVHVSAIGADPNSPSNYGRTKAEGEDEVRTAFPHATIVRPSLVFGSEDELTNRFAPMARLAVLPVIAAARKFQPVFVRDISKAIAMAALDTQQFGGRTYEIGGPRVMSMVELHREILEITGQKPEITPVPDVFTDLLSRLGWLPGAPLTRAQWLIAQRDNAASGKHPGIEASEIKPQT